MTPARLDAATTESVPAVTPHVHSGSLRADDAYDDEFQDAWDNEAKFQVSRHLLHLRRYRRESQKSLAKKVGTSQSAIARIEGGDENITLDTLQRLICALRGRLQVSIPPAEISVSKRSLWWETLGGSPWEVKALGLRRNSGVDQALIFVERRNETSARLISEARAD
jgi:transcriptional regulator with XRE-family HTH domain